MDYDFPLVLDVDQDPAEMWLVNLTKSEVEVVAAGNLREKATMSFQYEYDLPGEPPYAVC